MKTINDLGVSNFEFATTVITQLSNKAKLGVEINKEAINNCISKNLSEIQQIAGVELITIKM